METLKKMRAFLVRMRDSHRNQQPSPGGRTEVKWNWEDRNPGNCIPGFKWARFSKEDAAKWASARLTFYNIHATCFAVVIGLATLLLWLSPKRTGMSFVDALYNATSAVSVTGLISIDIRAFSALDQFTILVCMLLGSQIFTSLVPLYARWSRLSAILTDCPCHRVSQNVGLSRDPISAQLSGRGASEGEDCQASDTIDTPNLSQGEVLRDSERQNGTASTEDNPALTLEVLPSPKRKKECVSARAAAVPQTVTGVTMDQLQVSQAACPSEIVVSDKCSNQSLIEREDATEGGPSSLVAPLPCARKHLEYKAVQTLGWMVPLYFFGFQVAGFLVVQLYLSSSPGVSQVPRDNKVNPTMFAIFSSVSAMTNGGFSLLEDSMVPLQRSGSFLLVTYGCLILLGNTMFAPTLRSIIWLHHRWAKGTRKTVYRFLLENPRDCYTHLFPLKQTLWLVITITGFNVIEIFVFCVLEWKSRAFDAADSAGEKLLAAAFQALNSRTAGMNVVDLVDLTPAMLVLYLGMMYVAAYPVFISRQTTYTSENAAQTNSTSEQPEYPQNAAATAGKVVLTTRNLVARDSLFLFVSLLVVCLVENPTMQEDPLNYSMFNILFEVISAYSNVGLSVGYSCRLRPPAGPPCTEVTYSFSGKWKTFNKLIVVMVMFFGRHRALPDDLDQAIALPTQHLWTNDKPPLAHACRLKHRRYDAARTRPI